MLHGIVPKKINVKRNTYFDDLTDPPYCLADVEFLISYSEI